METDPRRAAVSSYQRELLVEAVRAIQLAVGADVVDVSPDGISARLVVRVVPDRTPHPRPWGAHPRWSWAEAGSVVREAERILAERGETTPDPT
jgi:hypothetical protein